VNNYVLQVKKDEYILHNL